MTLPLVGFKAHLLRHAHLRPGVKISALEGWRERTRPYDFRPVGFLYHHTSSSAWLGPGFPGLGWIVTGSDIAPLAQLMYGRGVREVKLVAAGYCNHGGLGGPLGPIPRDSANKYTAAVEIELAGVTDKLTEDELEDLGWLGACHHTFHGTDPAHSWAHKEWAPGRKVDPHPMDMADMRRRVLRYHTLITAPEEDDMPYTEAQLKFIVEAATKPLADKLDRVIRQGQAEKRIGREARDAARDAAEAGMSPEQVGAQVERAVSAALAEGIDIEVTAGTRGPAGKGK
jgi:hypothetical protein